MDLVLFGIQGSGKGTQAKKLAENFGYTIFEMGAELRCMSQSDTETGRCVKACIDAGQLVPPNIIMDVVSHALLKINGKVLFDGIPRDMHQMREFDTVMTRFQRSFRCVQLTLDDATAFVRIQGRAKEQGRADDMNPDAVQKRIAIFKANTVPVVEEYRKEGKMIDVDASPAIDQVFENLKKVLSAS